MTRLRCTVESMQYSACGMQVGDWFEVDDRGSVSLPAGRRFCWFAMASVIPLLNGTPGVDRAEWLASEPLIACPDPPERLWMRLTGADAQAGMGS